MDGKNFCNQCGREATPGTTFCVQCGARLSGGSATLVVAGAAAAPAMASGGYTGAATYPCTPAPVRYGGFWIRFVALIIDWIIVECVVMPLSFVIGGAIGIASSVSRAPGSGLGGQILASILGFTIGVFGNWIYEAAMESSSKQATLGKMIFGMKVTDLNGNRISFGRASGRHFAKYISGLILLIGYIMAGFTEKKQALHDMIAGTLVRR
jgi:uncharacterized RDD family membrane protein YckC